MCLWLVSHENWIESSRAIKLALQLPIMTLHHGPLFAINVLHIAYREIFTMVIMNNVCNIT